MFQVWPRHIQYTFLYTIIIALGVQTPLIKPDSAFVANLVKSLLYYAHTQIFTKYSLRFQPEAVFE